MFAQRSHDDLETLSNRDQVKLAFGLKQGRIAHISEVSRGKSCDCICPECKRALVAHKGNLGPNGITSSICQMRKPSIAPAAKKTPSTYSQNNVSKGTAF